MSRSRQAAAGLVVIALLASSPAPAKEVFKSIKARMTGGPAVVTRVSIAIESYTTDEEARVLLQAAGRGGMDAVVGALRNLNKGLVSVTNALEWRINAARVYPNGSDRRIVIIWDRAAIRAAPSFLSQTGFYGVMSDYFSGVEPFGVVELELNSKGKGVGRLFEAAAVRIDDHGFVDVEQFAAPAQLLVEVQMDQ